MEFNEIRKKTIHVPNTQKLPFSNSSHRAIVGVRFGQKKNKKKHRLRDDPQNSEGPAERPLTSERGHIMSLLHVYNL